MESCRHTNRDPSYGRSVKERWGGKSSAFDPGGLCGFNGTDWKKQDFPVPSYLDRYGLSDVFLFVFILICSVADAFFTINLVDCGMLEMNYIMNYYLRLGPLPFVLVKYLLTAVGLVWLIIYRNYPLFCGRLRVKAIMIGLAIIYGALITYEMALFQEFNYFTTFTLSMTTGLTGTF